MACILIAEDDAQTARLMRSTLEGEGHSVHAVADGELCLAAARETVFDLALVDIVLPGRSGLEVVEDLRREFRAMKIIAMSGGGPRRPDQLLVRAMISARIGSSTNPSSQPKSWKPSASLLTRGRPSRRWPAVEQ